MIHFKRTSSDNFDFIQLINKLDEDLALKNGDKNDFFTQFNKIDFIKHIIVAYNENEPVGCGAFKEFNEDTVEIKRMYVSLSHRRKGIARVILNQLERWAEEQKYSYAILETGEQMKEAIYLYQSSGYKITPNYPPYENEPSSVCFKKTMK